MKTSTIFTIIIFTTLCTLAQYPVKIKVMTYNINAENDNHKNNGSYTDIAEVIKAINPEICGLQKVDSCNSRNTADVLKWLGDQTDCNATFAPAIKNYNGSTGSFGIGLLGKELPQSVRRLWIEHTSSETDRGVLEIGITMGNEKVRVIVTHLAHEGVSYRTSQVSKIIPWIDSISTADPVIIMADFNAAPTENCMKLLETAGFNPVKGKNGKILDTTANQGINHILYRPASRWVVLDAGNPAYAASNRNPVWADMELTGTSVVIQPENNTLQNVTLYLDHGRMLRYALKKVSVVALTLYNASGRQVVSFYDRKIHKRGSYSVSLNKHKVPNGLYYCILSSDNERITKKIILLK